jgi:formiminotetrahydrofolate cyclodeaminase
MPTTYSTSALIDLLDAFASSDPVPAGGCAAALTGAVGASLLVMVASLPKTRTGAPEEVADLAQAASQLRPLRDALVTLVDSDSAAYEAVMAALRLPKATDEQKAARREALASAMLEATEVPLDTMRRCRHALALARIVAGQGYGAAASDAYVGIELLVAAARGAARNVDENLGGVKDPRYVEKAGAERHRLEDEILADATAARAALSR